MLKKIIFPPADWLKKYDYFSLFYIISIACCKAFTVQDWSNRLWKTPLVYSWLDDQFKGERNINIDPNYAGDISFLRLGKSKINQVTRTTPARHCLKTRRRPRLWTWEKTDRLKTVAKTGPYGLKSLSFDSCYMKDNVEVIHFHVKSRAVQSLLFVQIKFEKWTTNLV